MCADSAVFSVITCVLEEVFGRLSSHLMFLGLAVIHRVSVESVSALWCLDGTLHPALNELNIWMRPSDLYYFYQT